MENTERQGSSNEKETKGGFFTGRLAWWQVLLGLLLVGYLVYGKYQESVVKAAGTPPSAPAKAQ